MLVSYEQLRNNEIKYYIQDNHKEDRTPYHMGSEFKTRIPRGIVDDPQKVKFLEEIKLRRLNHGTTSN